MARKSKKQSGATKRLAVSHLKNAVANAKYYLNSIHTNCRELKEMSGEFRRVIGNANKVGVAKSNKAVTDARLYAREMRLSLKMHGCKVRR